MQKCVFAFVLSFFVFVLGSSSFANSPPPFSDHFIVPYSDQYPFPPPETKATAPAAAPASGPASGPAAAPIGAPKEASKQSPAETLFDAQLKGPDGKGASTKDPETYKAVFIHKGVPAFALQKVFSFLKANQNREISVKVEPRRFTRAPLKNTRTVAIIDYSLPSTKKRLYLLNLETGSVETHLVSHGLGSGYRWAHFFSNQPDSRKTSLGLYLTGSTYQSGAFEGTALRLYGLEETNNNAFERVIVMHAASYASPNFITQLPSLKPASDAKTDYQPRLGRSFGCFALDPAVASRVIDQLKGGALLFAYSHSFYEPFLPPPLNQELKPDPRDDLGFNAPIELAQREPTKPAPPKADAAKPKKSAAVSGAGKKPRQKPH